jgi:hypothetical protein
MLSVYTARRTTVFTAIFAGVVSLFGASTTALHAQALGTSTVAVDSTLVFDFAAAPKPGSWRVGTSAGFRFEDGRADTRGYSLSLTADYTSQASILWRFEADWQRAEARPTKDSPMYVIDDTRFGAFSASKLLRGRLGMTAMASWRQDLPLDLDHRIMAQAGPLFAWANSPTLSVSSAPMLGWGRQNNARIETAESIVHFGGVQTLTWHASPYTTLQAYISGHRVFEEAEDYSFTVNTSVSGALTRHLGVNVFYRLYEEGIQPPGVARRQHTLGAGFKLVFPSLATQGG